MCTGSALTQSPQVGTISAVKAISTSNKQDTEDREIYEEVTDLGIPLWTISKGNMSSGMNINAL